jgi:hypothetical protein
LLCLDGASPLSQDEWQLIQRYRKTDARGRQLIQQVADKEGEYVLTSAAAKTESGGQ